MKVKLINWLIKLLKVNMNSVSDGYHTFDELYNHRAVLFSVICNHNPELAWKSLLHDDATMFQGMFIVGIDTPLGQVTYHYDICPYWNYFQVNVLSRSPKWDGHTADQVLHRLWDFGRNPAGLCAKEV